MSETKILKVDTLKPELKTLICMVGLPYSGKSWAARSAACDQPIPVVCPDAIRVALHGHKFIPEAEPYVWAIARTMVRALFMAGSEYVILDATNTTQERRKQWMSEDWSTKWHEIRTPKERCIQRAKANGDMDILPIIEKMAEEITFPSDIGV